MAGGRRRLNGAVGRALRKLEVDLITMTKRPDSEIIVGLDIGTSKVLAVVAEVKENEDIEILGVGQHSSRGLRKGVVANIDSTVQSIQQAIEEAELTAECRISSVYAGIAGGHINSMNSHGVAAIKNRDEVTPEDVERVLDAAQAQAIPNDQQVLHILPQDFIIDGQDGIREPIGMSGVRLEAKVHIITGAVSAAQNIVKCITRCGLEVEEVVLEQVASDAAGPVAKKAESDTGGGVGRRVAARTEADGRGLGGGNGLRRPGSGGGGRRGPCRGGGART